MGKQGDLHAGFDSVRRMSFTSGSARKVLSGRSLSAGYQDDDTRARRPSGRELYVVQVTVEALEFLSDKSLVAEQGGGGSGTRGPSRTSRMGQPGLCLTSKSTVSRLSR